MTTTQRTLLVIGVLTLLRFIAGAVIPLSCDETYYWLWSKHLSEGYFDDPPMIAYAIRAGTTIFGDVPFGLRFVPLLLGVFSSWCVWRAGAILLRDEDAGLRACLFFNATIMVAVEAFAATPDAPMLAFSALFLLGLAKVEQTDKGVWWLLVGVAGGLGLMTKNTMFFVGFGALIWLVVTPSMRRWLATPWPYLGGTLAVLIFLPNILWNAQHHWATFGLQVNRMEAGGLGVRHLGEFIGSMAGLATPFILVLGAMGLWVATRARTEARLSLLAAMLWPSLLYFLWHSLHDRVQGNWPSYTFPMLAIAAAEAARRTDWKGWAQTTIRISQAVAMPVALVLLAFVYVQAFFDVIPIGRADPMTRLMGVGIPELAAEVEKARIANSAGAILTTDYPTTGWFAFYTPSRPPLIQVGDDNRWLASPVPSIALEEKPMIYVTEVRHDLSAMLQQHFQTVTQLALIDRKRGNKPIAHYVIYRVQGLKHGVLGRQPQG
jgi:4-amino-4-deoxy-L-arabinose transferase-like glycosyltransferase